VLIFINLLFTKKSDYDSGTGPNEEINTIHQTNEAADPTTSTRVRKMPKYLVDYKLSYVGSE